MRICFHILLFLFFSGNLLGQVGDTIVSHQTIHIQKAGDYSTPLKEIDTTKKDSVPCYAHIIGSYANEITRKNILTAGALSLKGTCDCTLVSYKMKFARRIVNYQLKKILKVNAKRYYLVANDARFTDDMISVLEKIPKGENILIYAIRAKTKSGDIIKLKNFLLKLK
ncbi:MAG TPA: hypothetical protein VNY36_08355 [Bacteroidia bacterium]|nr:hypothetical protein [Bacteroidia bacterium]